MYAAGDVHERLVARLALAAAAARPLVFADAEERTDAVAVPLLEAELFGSGRERVFELGGARERHAGGER
jgi:hypothetical protein